MNAKEKMELGLQERVMGVQRTVVVVRQASSSVCALDFVDVKEFEIPTPLIVSTLAICIITTEGLVVYLSVCIYCFFFAFYF